MTASRRTVPSACAKVSQRKAVLIWTCSMDLNLDKPRRYMSFMEAGLYTLPP